MTKRNYHKREHKEKLKGPQIQRQAWILLAIAIFAIALIRIRLLPVPLERDEGEYAYAGQLILKGIPPYLHVYNMKFPGIYAVYALIMALFGQTIVSIHLGLLIVNIITIVLIFLIGKRFFSPTSSVVGATTYAIFSLGQPVLGMFAHATHFVVLFALCGYLLLMKVFESKRILLLFLSGFCFGIAILMKQHGFLFGAFALLYLVLVQRKNNIFTLKQCVAGTSLFALGLVIPLGITCLILIEAGVFNKFWFWTFTYIRQYASQVSPALGWELFSERAIKIFLASPLLWLLAALGFIIILANKEMRPKALFIIGLWIFSFLAICPGLYFRDHYFIMTLPANAMLVSAAFSYLNKITAGTKLAAMPLIIIIAAVGHSFFTQREVLFSLSPNMVSREIYGGNPFPESLKIAEYIRKHTSPNDTIAVLGSEPQIYFYSKRRSATGYIYMYPLMEIHPYALQMQMEMIREIEAAKPKILVCVSVSTSWLPLENSVMKVFDWSSRYARKYYDLVGNIEIIAMDYTRYSWGEEAAKHKPNVPAVIYVFKRKPTLSK
ncbi:MAG: glycosyltransferase family 39 protein [Armatimonadetes bacterium]|nr:glycosyltransferase family 39 protein [Armatimonadota bacterium]